MTSATDAPQRPLDLVQGHLVAGLFRVFVHLCPMNETTGCAVWAWVKAKAAG